MKQTEITLGAVTYEIRRNFTGTCSATELILEKLVKVQRPNPSFDEEPPKVV